MALGKDRKRILIGGGYVYVKDYSESESPLYHPVGHTKESQVIDSNAQEDANDETGEYVGMLLGDVLQVIKTAFMQTSKEEIDLIRNLANKRCAVLYLVPVISGGDVRIDVYEFTEARVVPQVDMTFSTKLRTLPVEFRTLAQAEDLFCVDMHEDFPFWGREDLTFAETDVLIGRV